MLELIIFSILLLFIFLGVAGYARFHTAKRSKTFEAKTALTASTDKGFSQLLDEQIIQQQPALDNVAESTITDEAQQLTLSSDGVLAAESYIASPLTDIPDTSLNGPVSSEMEEAQSADEVSPFNRHDKGSHSEAVSKNREWDIVIALTIIAPDGHVFLGQDIAAALSFVEMEAGEMHVFHRHSTGQQRQILFSVANLLAPGTLMASELPMLQTQGLVMFMRLPNPANSLIVFDAMLAAADKIAKRLNGQLRDEHRQILTEATLEKMRSRILNFNLMQQFDDNQFKHDYSN